MPELPEVEVAARNLRRWAGGRTVSAVTVADRRTVAPARPPALQALVRSRLASVDRRGKNLLLTFAHGRARTGVWSHLGMTGKWVRRAPSDPPPRFSRVRLDFRGGVVLHYVDMRLFGFFRPVPDAAFTKVPVLAALGPDPLHDGIDPARLAARLVRIGKPVKLAIMDQSVCPGVGNIQASEGLHRAGIDPRRPASSLTPAEVRRLARSLLASFRYTLARFAAEGADGPANSPKDIQYVEEPGTRNPFRVYDRAGARCPRCRKGTIERIIQGGRSTYFCPACQR
jgi:formamidopyrimidine-DNA glycosylase